MAARRYRERPTTVRNRQWTNASPNAAHATADAADGATVRATDATGGNAAAPAAAYSTRHAIHDSADAAGIATLHAAGYATHGSRLNADVMAGSSARRAG